MHSYMLIALANSKGGVGKTTIAVHLAVWLAEKGHRVTFIDSDVQASSSKWLEESAPGIAIHRLFTADEVIEQAPPIVQASEIIVADGPAGLSEVTRALLLIADMALLPCGPSALDLRAAQDAIRVVRQAQQIRKGQPQAYLIPNKLQSNFRLSRELLDTANSLEIPALHGLKLRQAYADAVGQGTVVWRLSRCSEAQAEMENLFTQIMEYGQTTTTLAR